MSIEYARKLAGKSGVIFGDRPVFLYDYTLELGGLFCWWKRQLVRDLPKVPNLHELLFWINREGGNYEALYDLGTLGGWPYYRRISWCAIPRNGYL